ncbi:hypothetical protein ElyMa_000367400 [Elysia marginata]|uniref:Uncharacterized protein n=1 Tax=Elysia marginata TaxID=1093978 RepID=A0AAV4FHZ3_9GAST|nr:hypothetical protein ElyMa_000367400 [Elysia marginata]
MEMQCALGIWRTDCSSAIKKEELIFPKFKVKPSACTDHLYISVPDDTQALIKLLAEAFHEVTTRQLADFLPGGRYHDVTDKSRQEKTSPCQLTNLMGEECLGDLDFSIFKRRHSSLHHHSTINMPKRNGTLCRWLMTKSVDKQDDQLKQDSRTSLLFRRRNIAKEKATVAQEQEKITARMPGMKLKKRKKLTKLKRSLP